jgi:hypothetical protein
MSCRRVSSSVSVCLRQLFYSWYFIANGILCRKSWRKSSTPWMGDVGPIYQGGEKSFRSPWPQFYCKYRTFSADFYKCRTSSIEPEWFKSNYCLATTHMLYAPNSSWRESSTSLTDVTGLPRRTKKDVTGVEKLPIWHPITSTLFQRRG